jgi:hypothetical protein
LQKELSSSKRSIKEINIKTIQKVIIMVIVMMIVMMIMKCAHCDVDAYYRLTVEDFNQSGPYKVDLCIKCIKTETKKIIEEFPAIKSLKVEPVLSVLTTTTIR